jgi:EmrB/QacA subfamily drug resistance transporter
LTREVPDVNETPGAASASRSPLTQSQVRLIILCVLLATLIAALDQTIVSTALPTIGSALGDPSQLTWVVTAYLLAATVVTPIYGKLSDFYGRRITILAAIALFVAGSVACALAPNMLFLIAARTFQGLGGGGLLSLSQTIIGDIVAPRERPRYQAYVSAVFVTASVAGPRVGGFIAEHLHWSLIFWINPPIGLLALLPIYSLLRKLPVSGQRHRIDITGAVLLVVATLAVMLALNWGGVRYPWSAPPVAALLGAFVIFTALFFVRETRAPEPLLPIPVLANQVVVTATLACATCMGTSMGLMIFTPIYFETVRGLTPSQSGLALIPFMLGTAIGAGIAGRLMASVTHYKRLPAVGLMVATVAMAIVSFDPRALPLWAVEALLAVTSIGFGTILPMTTICVQNAAPEDQLGTATALLVFARQLFGAIVVALFGAIMFGQIHATGQLHGLEGAVFNNKNVDFAAIFRWIFGAAALGFAGSLGLLLAMRELPLKEHVANEKAIFG